MPASPNGRHDHAQGADLRRFEPVPADASGSLPVRRPGSICIVSEVVQIAIGLVGSLAMTWVAFLVLLLVWGPRGMDLREAKGLVPDIVRLIRAMRSDPTVPGKVRRRLGYLTGYLAFPIDIVPDFIPVLGYTDDVVVIALALRSVVRAAGPAAISRHWSGTSTGEAIVRRLAGLPEVESL